MKRLKPILGISCLVQSITFFILCLVNVEKKKNTAAAYGMFSAIGGLAGAALLYSDYKDQKAYDEEYYDDEYFDEFLDEFDDDDLIEENEIDCTFATENAEA